MPTITDNDPILKGLRKIFKRDAKKKAPPARKMNELCLLLGEIEEGEAVASSLSAKVRGRLKRLVDDGTIEVNGEKATTTYTACA